MMLLQRLGVIGISAILIYALYRKKVGNKKLLCTIFWKQKEEEKVGLQVNGASQFCSHIALPRPHICFSLNTHGCNKVGWTSSLVCLVRKYIIANGNKHTSWHAAIPMSRWIAAACRWCFALGARFLVSSNWIPSLFCGWHQLNCYEKRLCKSTCTRSSATSFHFLILAQVNHTLATTSRLAHSHQRTYRSNRRPGSNVRPGHYVLTWTITCTLWYDEELFWKEQTINHVSREDVLLLSHWTKVDSAPSHNVLFSPLMEQFLPPTSFSSYMHLDRILWMLILFLVFLIKVYKS
jgi:hypothetical protein